MSEPIFQLPPVIHHRTLLSLDPAAALPWHVEDFGIDKSLWGIKGDEVVGVVDSGTSETHIKAGELEGQVKAVADFARSYYGPYDKHGHGSHVAGIIGAKRFGIAKNCAKLVCAKGLGDSGTGSDSGIVKAIRWCANQGASIINLSLGSDEPSPQINGICAELSQQGVLIVCAAGNSGGGVEQPAAQPWAIAVTALTRSMLLADFSCRGDEADTCAPGAEITSLNRGGSYAVMSGTSMACPWVAAILAVKRAADKAAGRTPLKSAAEVVAWLSSGAGRDLGKTGRDWSFGAGLPDPEKIAAVSPPVGPLPGVEQGLVAVTVDGKRYEGFIPRVA